MASGVYDRFKYNLFRGLADVGGGSGAHQIYVALLTSSHVFVAANNTWAAVSANETSGTAYVAGGQILTGVTVTQNDGATQAVFTASNTTWAASTITAAFAVLYDHTLINKDLVCCFDFGGNQSSSNGNFTISWNGSGIITLS